MGSLLILRPGHARLPDLTPLPDGRYRLTVYQKLPAAHYVAPEYGTLYDDTLTGDELARYSGLRLINIDPGNERYKSSVPSVTLVYEQLHATLETQVGKLTTVTDENDREVLQAQFIQFSSAAYVKGAIGTLTPPGVATAVLDGESASDEGILRKITRKYVQAGATFANVGEDEIDFELNGLKRRVRNLVALGGVSFTGTVGATTHPTDTGLILAGLSIRESAATTKVKATYLQPGVISKSRSVGEITGTISNSWTVWYSDPLPLMEAALGAVVPTADRTENVQGYPVRTLTALSGTITGLKTSYKTVSEVRTPGTITPTTHTSAIGTGQSVAYLQVVPPRTKTIPVTVEVSITTTPPNVAEQVAYNLENVSASATSITETYHGNGSRDLRYGDGTIGFRGARYSVSISVNESSYPGHTYVAAAATGTIAYDSDWTDADGDATDNTILAEAQGSVSTSKILCSGSSTATGFFTTGILQRKARPILTDLNGVQYWEVVTFIA